MLRRLWLILGPVFCAAVLVLLLLVFYPTKLRHNIEAEKRSAVTLTATSFKGRLQKVQALTDPDYRFVPFFGSSEWLRFDSMHPSVLAEKYDRSYRPYLLGQRGAASLNQYFGMQQMLPELENNTVVYVVSPQWFTKTGYDASAFQQYFNSDQLTSFLTQQAGDLPAHHAAERLLQLYPNVTMADIVKKVADGTDLSASENQLLELMARVNKRQDIFFSSLIPSYNHHYDRRVLPELEQLPAEFSYEALEEVAIQEAKEHTKTNDLGIDDRFYKKRLKSKIKQLEGSQKNLSYLKSPEYNDLQLVLHQFAQSKTNVLFVIPPVNAKWMAYTGLREGMYQQTVEKIKYQLQSQGFTNIADFSKDGGKPYFMQDTIHMGWLGWLEFDKVVDPFVANPQPAPTYQLNPAFFSKEWANYDGNLRYEDVKQLLDKIGKRSRLSCNQ
ncbi:D-alanyl-lipoteichoic acid biosynthesis protein DltD [Streptococcus acidominimus]|uniref:D-alanine transfer protein n=1 Tax=Streptococcus acidominimus TaxID=1326 RepID=A0A1Q8EF99_STRAI|nr:D-alanyl-lipoteichoic acid biosynthesis protein DltD [Streptococcus acidominimus]OLF50465.1 D-alanyl-lipoteichoic acid biosynthesis protein DltD [Streptococcus acidominimus]SUN05438.1 D-alanine transfer protein [Streptococcus acidominimus]